jgi:hypothetical protein
MTHVGNVVAAYIICWGLFMLYQVRVSRGVASLRAEVDRLKETLERGAGK